MPPPALYRSGTRSRTCAQVESNRVWLPSTRKAKLRSVPNHLSFCIYLLVEEQLICPFSPSLAHPISITQYSLVSIYSVSQCRSCDDDCHLTDTINHQLIFPEFSLQRTFENLSAQLCGGVG